ncbi:MAG: T9SS type A sorting domain-containing protein [Ignavibacteria bacterium]|nr:MAG: T9SS type A sorting domain-containing protein [Ignavibacteria bacterium]
MAGNLYLIVKTDTKDSVDEGGIKFNNTLRAPITINQASPGDLIIEVVNAPSSAVPGEDLTVSWTVRNLGPDTVSGEMTDAVYVSPDTAWSVDDPLLGVLKRDINIAPGSTGRTEMKVNPARTFALDSIGNLSDPLPGVAVGNYYVIVRTDIRNNIHETNDANNTGASAAPVAVDVPRLQLGVPDTSSLVQSQRKYYKVDVGADLDLRVRLTGNLSAASNEVYVAYGKIPSPASYDFTGSEPLRADQDVVVPSTQAGSYYILVLARHTGGAPSEGITIRADALPFSITNISPPEGGRGGRTTCLIEGAGFRDTTQFYLRDTTGARIAGTVLHRVSSTQAYVRFDLSNAAYGAYDIAASNGSAAGSLGRAFTVSVPIISRLEHEVLTPYAKRGVLIGRPASYDIDVHNGNNNDIDVVILTVLVPASQPFSIQTSDFIGRPAPGLPDSITLPNAGLRLNQDWAAMTILAKGVRSGQFLKARLNMSKLAPACAGACLGEYFPVIVDVRGLSYSEFLAFEVDFLGQIRAEILKLDPATIPPRVAALMQNPNWQTDAEQAYLQVGLLDDRPILARTLPLVYDPNDTTHLHHNTSVMQLLAGGSGGFCKNAVNLVSVLFSFYTVMSNIVLLSSGADAAFLFGALTVGGPVGWIIVGALAVVLAYNLYKMVQGDYLLTSNLICRKLLNSFDPNDIAGPPGYGSRRWIGVAQSQGYTIRFENDPKLASAPAQTVAITHPLDSTADSRSFRLGSFGFANFTFNVPQNRSYYTHRLDLRDSLGIYVDVTAGLDITKNQAFWIFSAVDPSTGQRPVNPLLGLLPVNDSTNRGQGFVSFQVKARNSSHTGDSLRAGATIVFDVNAPINTPTISNTIDAGLPRSRVALLPASTNSTSFNVHWSGGDDSLGSGLANYSVYVSRNDSSFAPLILNTTDTLTTFNGALGSRYSFYSLATDNAGNTEGPKGSPDAQTTVTGVKDQKPPLPRSFFLYQNYPNPFNPATTIRYDLPRQSRVSLRVYTILGQEIVNLVDDVQEAGEHSVRFNASNYASGVYFYRLQAADPAKPDRLFAQIRKMLLIK